MRQHRARLSHSVASRVASAFLVLFCVALLLHCGGGEPERSSSAPAPPSTTAPVVEQEPEALDLATGVAQGDLEYTLSGSGTSTSMRIQIRNRKNRIWIVHIEEGYRLTPAEGNVQVMVVTKETHVRLHPHETETIEVDVACLDISKLPPAATNTSWTVRPSQRLKRFLNCTHTQLDEAKQEATSDEAELIENLRPTIVQFAIWKARGALRDQWIEFWVEYQGTSSEEANQIVDAFDPVLVEIVDQCGQLTGI